MTLEIKHQESYSKGELLLRSFFGFFYILIPHGIVMLFVAIWNAILGMIAWWIILFTGKYPRGWFDSQVRLMYWNTRLNATLFNLVDGYPAIGPSGTSDSVKLEVEYPETLSRGLLLLKTFLGIFYVTIPHGFMLVLRVYAGAFLGFLAWWVVLFTGKYPERWHRFNVGTLRWGARVGLYMGNMSDEYPPFSGKA